VERSEVLQVLREKAREVLGSEVEDLAAADSLAVVELVMDVEDAFGVELSEAEVGAAGTLADLADLVLAKTP
jgi:acyl carrier protein